jgi:hypothetical protein
MDIAFSRGTVHVTFGGRDKVNVCGIQYDQWSLEFFEPQADTGVTLNASREALVRLAKRILAADRDRCADKGSDDSFEAYLFRAAETNVIDHALRVTLAKDLTPTFYVHPHGVDGDTKDFRVRGEVIEAIDPADPLAESA